MDKRKFLILFLIFAALVSISTVCASDATADLNMTTQIDDNTDLSIDDDEELSVADDSDTLSKSPSSFKDLNNKINSDYTISLLEDYKFNDATDGDFANGLDIDKDGITINGNNHYIDANYKADIFNIYGSNIVIKNLIFKNANTALYIYNNYGEVETSNVTFMNCNGPNADSAVVVLESIYTSNNDKFIDNRADFGSSIYAGDSEIYIDGGLFENHINIGWSLIYGESSYIEVTDTIFTNTTSKYATAIYNSNGETHIKKSRFINLFATITAGGLAFKEESSVEIEECEFINVSSTKNGGAIYVDINGDDKQEGNVIIRNTLFKDCKSDFGGAYLQLGGELDIIDSRFINNYAESRGGAVYLSNTATSIENSIFTGNKAESNHFLTSGGAVFCDDSGLTVEYCEFNNNAADEGGAIYAYDTIYLFDTLELNGNENPIHTAFDYGDCEVYNLTGSDEIDEDNFNEMYYPCVFLGAGMQITLINQTDIHNLPSKYDLRELNLVTPVKDQGEMGSCWAFGMTAALESALLKVANYTASFSENNMQNTMLRYSQYGDKETYEGGLNLNAIAYLLSWFGAFPQSIDSYDELGKVSVAQRTNEDIHIQDIIIIPHTPGNKDSINNVKNAIIKYGALAAYINAKSTSDDEESVYYNNETFAQYNNKSEISNHAVCVVGWDDDYSIDNFRIKPKGNGAWIVKNSWGTDWGDEGYFYVSYYDKTFCAFPDIIEECFVAIPIENTINYNKNYEYDLSGLNEFEESKGAKLTYTNNFVAYSDDVIAAVGTYFNKAGVEYTVEISVNDNVVYNQTGISPYYGYHTIKLDKYVSINEDDSFSVSITSNAVPLCKECRALFKEGTSILTKAGKQQDLSEKGWVACLKAYTLENSINTKNIEQYYSDYSSLNVNVGKKNVDVTISINGENMTAPTKNDGIARFTLNYLKPGCYDIITYYNGIQIVNYLKILTTIEVDREVSIVYDSGSGITATFYDSNGEPLKRTSVTVTYDGKTEQKSTNNQGKVTIFIADYSKDQTVTFTNPETGEVASTRVHILPKPTVNPPVPVVLPGANPQKVVLTLQKVKIKKSAKKLVIKATLKINGKLANGKKVTFKFNGKKYVVKTKKGVAKLTIKKNVLKKLKVGKKLTYQVTYLKKTVKKTVKVK